jgi:vacuolar-type H+-ATPase catalytic subunit A/Vma1
MSCWNVARRSEKLEAAVRELIKAASTIPTEVGLDAVVVRTLRKFYPAAWIRRSLKRSRRKAAPSRVCGGRPKP